MLYITKFNKVHSELINKLSRKRNPMTEEEASSIDITIESFLKLEVDRYQKKLKYQRRSWPLFKNLSPLDSINMINREMQSNYQY